MLQEIEGLFGSMERIVGLRSKLLGLFQTRGPEASDAGPLRRELAEQVGMRDMYARLIASQIGLAGPPLVSLQQHLSGSQRERLQSCLDQDRKVARKLQAAGCRQATYSNSRRLHLQRIFCA